MPKLRRSARRGLTLIEILISMIIMVLGVLGILALFPPALQSAKESMEETNAAIVGESVAHALTTGFRTAYYNPASKQWEITLAHDLVLGNTRGSYTFTPPPLPADPSKPDVNWYHYPSVEAPPDKDPGKLLAGGYEPDQDKRLFGLGGESWIATTVKDVHEVNDPTDAYAQFAFSFDLRKVHTVAHLVNQRNPNTNNVYTEQELEDLTKLYEARIYIFRTANQPASFGPGGTVTAQAGSDFRRLVAIITKRISSR